jgi:hypothetical protein
MLRRQLVLLSGPCAAQKNAGGGVDSGPKASLYTLLACFNAHLCLFTILGRYKFFSAELAKCTVVLNQFDLLLYFGLLLVILSSYYSFFAIVFS